MAEHLWGGAKHKSKLTSKLKGLANTSQLHVVQWQGCNQAAVTTKPHVGDRCMLFKPCVGKRGFDS